MLALQELAVQGDMQARVLMIQSELVSGHLSPRGMMWLMEMAEAGDPYACVNMYYYLMSHEEVKVDWYRVKACLELHIKENPGEAYDMLSGLYAPGLPGFEDMDKCVTYLHLGVGEGSAPCAHKLVHLAHELMPGLLAPEQVREILEKCGLEGAPVPVLRAMVDACQQMEDYTAGLRYVRLWQKMYPKDADACIHLAYYYANGLGTRQDYKLAMKYYQKAANLKDGRGMFYLGLMNYEGTGCRCNVTRAAEWFERAVRAGCGSAYSLLARCYMLGDGVPENPAKAVKLLREGVERKEYACCYWLALCYYEGKHVKQELRRALKLLDQAREYRKSMEVENLDVEILKLEKLCVAARIAMGGKGRLPAFLQEWERARDAKDIPALEALVEEAARKLSHQKEARDCILSALEQGLCCTEVAKKVLTILRPKADSDRHVALFVAHMYLQGYGCRPSPNTAYRYYEKAWRTEYDEELGLDIVLRLLDGSLASNTFDAGFWIARIAQFCGGTPRLNYLRGLLYASGSYYRKNRRKAENYFQLAADSGFSADSQADLSALNDGSKTLRDCLGVPPY